MTNQKKLILTLILFIILFVNIKISNSRTSDFNPLVDRWYKVEDWELDVCSKWGGAKQAYHYETSNNNKIYLSQLTLTLQAEKIVYPSNNSVLYKVSWYFEPAKGEYKYEINLLKNGGSSPKQISSGAASYESPAVGSYAEYLNEDYAYAQLVYENKWVKVPIIETENE